MEEPGNTGTPGRTRAPGATPHPPYARALLLRLLPLTLLIIVGLAGLRGGMAAPKWNGPMQRDKLAVGLAVEIGIRDTDRHRAVCGPNRAARSR